MAWGIPGVWGYSPRGPGDGLGLGEGVGDGLGLGEGEGAGDGLLVTSPSSSAYLNMGFAPFDCY